MKQRPIEIATMTTEEIEDHLRSLPWYEDSDIIGISDDPNELEVDYCLAPRDQARSPLGRRQDLLNQVVEDRRRGLYRQHHHKVAPCSTRLRLPDAWCS